MDAGGGNIYAMSVLILAACCDLGPNIVVASEKTVSAMAGE
jgi:hypothetical protein